MDSTAYGIQSPLPPSAAPELVVKLRLPEGSTGGVPPSAEGDLGELLASAGARLQPVLDPRRVSPDAATAPPSAAAPLDAEAAEAATFFHVLAPADRLLELAERLRTLDTVEAAYVKPPVSPPGASAIPALAPLMVPDFNPRQRYFAPSPAGFDFVRAHGLPGGRGAGVNIVDVEGAWNFLHADLQQHQGGLLAGTQRPEGLWRHHGTAVIGVLGGDANGFGVTGVCPEATVRAVSFEGLGTAAAIMAGADALRPGDVLIVELQRTGPRSGFFDLPNTSGHIPYIPVEWWPDDLAAIRYAAARGVIVVEAAGNGGENLDDPLYDVPATGFPATWRNPFRRGADDAGAILVGAGAPPPGTHGRTHGPDRARLAFSNYGVAVDAQGWGREVTTAGYGDLHALPGSEAAHYTDVFSGTSSATPLVAGVLACVQGVLRHLGRAPLTPSQARDALRNTGAPQQPAPGAPITQRIGRRPDLDALLQRTVGT